MRENFDEHYFLELIRKFLNGTASEEELRFIQSYYAWFDHHQDVLDGFNDDQLEQLKQLNLNSIWKKVEIAEQAQVPAIPHFRKYKWRYTAAAAAIILLSFSINFLRSTEPSIVQPIPNLTATVSPTDIIPGGNKAVLTLGDGSSIELDSASSGELAQQGEIRVVKLANGQVAYNVNGVHQGESLINTMTTPKGGKYQLILHDGTRVWLNAASSITYPTIFPDNERKVKITGEVYFEVVTNPQKPFKVETYKEELVVLGTSFNVNSYKDEKGIKTSLFSGSLKVQNMLLKPGQAHIEGTVSKTNLQQDIAWKNGVFNFDNMSLKNAMRQIARWYDVDIQYTGTIREIELAGEIGRNLTLKQVLSGLQDNETQFKLEGKTLYVHTQ